MKLRYGFAVTLICVASCDVNAPPAAGSSCFQTFTNALERQAAELESRGDAAAAAGLRSAEMREDARRQCDCHARMLTPEDHQFLLGAVSLREALIAQGLPQDVIIYRIGQYAGERFDGDVAAGEAHLNRLVQLSTEACPPSELP